MSRRAFAEVDQLCAGDVIVVPDRPANSKPRKVYAINRIPNGCGVPRGACGYVKANYAIELSNRVIICSEDVEVAVLL